MADVEPLHALHYDLSRVGGLQPVAAPPYDVIDAAQRAELVGRSPYNVVEVDLPQNGGGDIYEHAAEVLTRWNDEGIVVRDEKPALWALAQDYTGPDGAAAHPPRRLRARARRGLRPRPDPPARAHAPRSEGGPAAAHARHAREPLPHLQPLRRPGRTPPGARCEPHLNGDPWGEVTDEDGTVHRLWRVDDARRDRRPSATRCAAPSC